MTVESASKRAGTARVKTKAVSASVRAGLQFPVGRIRRLMRKSRAATRIGGGAPVYMAAVLEYFAAEVLELAANAAKESKRHRIIPRHIQLAIRTDPELNQLVGEQATIASGGVMPYVHPALLKKVKEPAVTGAKGGKAKAPATAAGKKPAPKKATKAPRAFPKKTTKKAEEVEEKEPKETTVSA